MFKRALDIFNRSAAAAEESNGDRDGGVHNTPPLSPSAAPSKSSNMFKRALDKFNRSAAAAEESNGDGGVHDTPPLSSSAATEDKNDLENPLLATTNDYGGVHDTPPLSPSAAPSKSLNMFKRAFNIFNRSAAAVEESNGDGRVHDTPPSSPSAATEEKNDPENPLLAKTNEDGSETPTLSIPPFSGGCGCGCGCSITKIFKDPRCGWFVLGLVFLTIFGICVYLFVEEINRTHNDPGFKLDYVVVSSFNVSKTFPKTRWDTELSLGLPAGGFSDLDVRYEAPRLWLYSGDEGFVSTTFPSMEYSPDGKKLVMRAVFGMEEDVQHRVVNLDVLMESNAISIVKIHSSQVEIKSFLIIDCNDLKIEFDHLNRKFGTLVDVGKSCKVQICLIESHPLYDGADKCTSNSYKVRFGKLRPL